MMSGTETIPIYAYTLTLTPIDGEPPPTRTIHAMGFELDGHWMTFDDTTGTVLTVRAERVLEVARGEQVATQEVDTL